MKTEEVRESITIGKKQQNHFRLKFERYSSSDIVDLTFLKGNSICLYKEDVRKLFAFLLAIYRKMK